MDLFKFKKDKLLNHEEEIDLFKRLKKGDDEAKDDLLKHNMNLVLKIANGRKNMGIDFEDLVQEGIIGLIHAIEKFDYNLGNRFSTYAFPWITQAVNNAITNKAKQIRLPYNLVLILERIKKLQNELPNISVDALAERLSVSNDKIKELLKYQNLNFLSLDSEMADSIGCKLKNSIEDIKSSFEFTKIDVIDELSKLFSKLSEKEANVLHLRFFENETLNKIGEKYGVTRESIRLTEKRALEKLRKFYFSESYI
jgi:RNA polymerase primary sigma factor